MIALPHYSSLAEIIPSRVKQDPEALALVFLANNGSEEAISIGRLHILATRYARALQARGIGPDDLVVLALRFSLDLLAAFWGVLYVGATPSIFPHQIPMADQDTFLQQLHRLVTDAGGRAVLAEADVAPALATTLAEAGCVVLEPGEVVAGASDLAWVPDTYTADEQIAYVQFTSGTTGLRKGVRLSHRAILNYLRTLGSALEVHASDVSVNWLPLYHDFGLFCGLALPLVYEIPAVMMSSFKFVRSPHVLFQAIHKYNGTLCWVTNTAMNHATRVLKDGKLIGLDLRSLRMLASGGEPVIHKTLERFLVRFSPYGLCEEALAAGYGLAENTLASTLSPIGAGVLTDWINAEVLLKNRRAMPAKPYAEGTRPIVSCGVPLRGVAVQIVDDERRPLPERYVGEISLHTPNLFSGYHRRPDLTRQVLSDGWLFTGDIGYLAEGHLYVCGRKKDVIITGGQNIHPEDIEAVARDLPEIVPNRAVSFGVLDEDLGTDKVILVCDLLRSIPDTEYFRVEQELRRRVYRVLGIALTEVLLVKKGWVVLTANGKIPRAANREKYLRLVGDQGQLPRG